MSDKDRTNTANNLETEQLKKELLSQDMGGTATTVTYNQTGVMSTVKDDRSEIKEEESKIGGSYAKRSRMSGDNDSKISDRDDDDASGSESEGDYNWKSKDMIF